MSQMIGIALRIYSAKSKEEGDISQFFERTDAVSLCPQMWNKGKT